jgi:hypothetical protein
VHKCVFSSKAGPCICAVGESVRALLWECEVYEVAGSALVVGCDACVTGLGLELRDGGRTAVTVMSGGQLRMACSTISNFEIGLVTFFPTSSAHLSICKICHMRDAVCCCGGVCEISQCELSDNYFGVLAAHGRVAVLDSRLHDNSTLAVAIQA